MLTLARTSASSLPPCACPASCPLPAFAPLRDLTIPLCQERYAVEGRVAGAHVADLDSGAKRAASYQIMKNRGLVAYKVE